MNSQTESHPTVPGGIRLALITGFYVFISAWFIAPDRSAHHTIVYLIFLAPALIHLLTCTIKRDPALRGLESPLYLSLVLFLGYMVISTLWSDIADEPMHYVKRMAQTLIFIYGVYIIARFEQKHFWLSIVTGIALCAPWLAINLIFFPEEAFISERFKGANAGIHYLLTGAMLGAFLALGGSMLVKRLENRGIDLMCGALLVGTGIVFYAVLLTESRSALLAILTVIAYFVFTASNIRHFKVIVMLCAALSLLLLAPYAELFISRGFSQRFEIWGQTLQWIWQHPFFGHGFGAEYILHVSSGEELYDAHNIHLEVLYEGGLIGGLLWAVFLFFIAQQGWKHRDSDLGHALLALFIYSIVAKSFESRGILSRPTEFWHLIWLCAGMALALSQMHTASRHSCEQSREKPSG